MMVALIDDGDFNARTANPCATAKPPKPAPTMTTWCSSGRQLVARSRPGVQTAMKRPNLFEAVVHQYLGDARGGRFARTGAVENDFPIARQFLQAVCHFRQRHVKRARNPARFEGARGRRSYVDDDGRCARLDQAYRSATLMRAMRSTW